jgi:NOL1/NOP2/sun family putative RNA methylase
MNSATRHTTPPILQRYRGIVDDWDRFWESHHTPEPIAFRVRWGLVDPDELCERLRTAGFRLSLVPGVPNYVRVDSGPGSVAQTVEHWLGLLHVQQAVMALPPLALAAKPGERVLDLCAAPGGKTTHLAELMRERGSLIAVDRKEKRIRGLLGNLYRLGYQNVVVIAGDGRQLPLSSQFDRVLLDVPCSGEGNYRRQGGRSSAVTPRFSAYISELQRSLLRRAIRLTRPGGTIVYSTCTYSPEENEAVLDDVLRDAPVTVEEIPLDLPHCPGLDGWNGRPFHPDLRRAWRVYPHHLDSGGLFMARMRRLPAGELDDALPPKGNQTKHPGWSSIPVAFPGTDRREARDRVARAKKELEHRFGLSPERLSQLGWMVRGKYVWAQTAGVWPLKHWCREQPEGSRDWRVVSAGLRAFRKGPGDSETASSHFLTRWSRDIRSSHRAELDRDQLLLLLRGERLPIGGLPAGPVAIAWGGVVLGRGIATGGELRHELGRPFAERLRTLLTAPGGTTAS